MPGRPSDAPRDDAPQAAHRLTRAHFRFLSGEVQGLDAHALWDRYLFALGPATARRVRTMTTWLHDELGALARRAGRPDVAALLRRRSHAAADSVTALTLDGFSATLPADMHSEAELLALWKESHGQASSRQPAQRRQRLIERQRAALQWLEPLAVQAPRLDDPVSVWLEPSVARRLAKVGIATLADLRNWIAHHGFHWYRRVPRIGAQGAARLTRWLAGHADTLGTLPAHSLAPRSQLDKQTPASAPTAGVVPLERLRLPPEMSGTQGSNRAHRHKCRIEAADDLAAIQTWLSRHAPASHTWRAYRREAERLLLWSVFERRKALSSLDATDCAAFREFLTAPGASWISPRHVPRGSDRWRPLEGGLSPVSLATALSIVKNLCAWLVRERYLEAQPWDAAQTARPPAGPSVLTRSLSAREGESLQRWLCSQPPGPSADRRRLLVSLAWDTGLRESELAAARTGWLRRGPVDGVHERWHLEVPSRGHGPARKIDLPDETARQLLDHLELTGPYPANGTNTWPDRPLFAHRSDAGRALSPGRIYTVLKSAFTRCAEASDATEPESATRLRQASTHWLRHTHAVRAAAAGMSLEALQRRLGHRSPASTASYLCAAGLEAGERPDDPPAQTA